MTQRELHKIIKKETGYSIKEIKIIIDSFTTNIGNALIDGEEVSIPSFGSFKVKTISSRRIKNVSTGEYQVTKVRNKIDFKACKELHDAIW